MAVNILRATYEEDNFGANERVYTINMTLDGSITVSEINDYLPNNGDRYKAVQHIAFIPSNSTAIILSTDTYFVCKFIAESGAVDSKTTYQQGIWKCIGKKTFLS